MTLGASGMFQNDPVLLPISSGRGLLYQGHEALYSKDVTCRGLSWVSGESDLWWYLVLMLLFVMLFDVLIMLFEVI